MHPLDKRLQSILTHVLHGDTGLPPEPLTTSSLAGGSAPESFGANDCAHTCIPGRVCPRIAAIVTTCFPRSHGDVILTKLIKGMSLDEKFAAPRVDIVSVWIDCIAATSP